ncbi:MAG: universal stress protein [Anaerolineae bacterium]|jgi:nucleotide-binding universal stress UspA family protein
MNDRVEHVVCAVRGSPQSRATVTRAIDLALEHGARLTFFYAADAEFLARTTIRGPLSVIYQELTQMAEFSMLILCDRARRRGVRQVDYVIREGNVRRQLLEFVAETRADVFVMGWPLRGPGRPTFSTEGFASFTTELEEIAHPRLVLVAPPEHQPE